MRSVSPNSQVRHWQQSGKCCHYISYKYLNFNRPFPSSPQPPFQSEAKCESVFIHIETGTNYNNKILALRLALKERLRGTPKWPITFGLVFLPMIYLQGQTHKLLTNV